MSSLVATLEASSWSAASAESSGSAPAPSLDGYTLVGRWELLYSNVEAFRNSPFFGAFTNVVHGLAEAAGLTGTINVGGELSDAIFAFTDAIPNATVGAAYQTVMPGSLVSEVDLAVFPGLKGTVVTTSRVASRSGGDGAAAGAGPVVLELMVESTRVERSNFSPFLDGIALPVEQLVRGGGGRWGWLRCVGGLGRGGAGRGGAGRGGGPQWMMRQRCCCWGPTWLDPTLPLVAAVLLKCASPPTHPV